MVQIPPFKNTRLLEQALTHRSYLNEHPEQGEDNERLEFLGDAVLKFIIAKLLYDRYPEMREGDLTRLRASLENNKHQLANFAKQLKLNESMRLGKGAELDGSRKNPELLADVFEAVIGAYYLDSGINKLIKFLESLLIPVAKEVLKNSFENQNLKGKFQEWALANLLENPRYSIIEESGLEHDKMFTAQVKVKGIVYGIGKGKSKKMAEKNAAENALKKVIPNNNSPTSSPIDKPSPPKKNPDSPEDFSTIQLNILKKFSEQINKTICDNCTNPSYCLAHNTCLIENRAGI